MSAKVYKLSDYRKLPLPIVDFIDSSQLYFPTINQPKPGDKRVEIVNGRKVTFVYYKYGWIEVIGE